MVAEKRKRELPRDSALPSPPNANHYGNLSDALDSGWYRPSRDSGFPSLTTTPIPSFESYESGSSVPTGDREFSQAGQQHQGASYSDQGATWSHVWQDVVGFPDSQENTERGTGFSDDLNFDSLASQFHATELEASIESYFEEQLAAEDPPQGTGLQFADSPPISAPNEANHPFDICLGMIYRANSKLVGDMRQIIKCLQSEHVPQTSTHFLLRVESTDEELFIKIPGNVRLAQLNKHLSESLLDLVLSGVLQLEALVHKKDLYNDIGTATSQKEAQTHVNVNIYSSSQSDKNPGRALSDKKIWLQRPDWHRPACRHENPHLLKMEDFSDTLQPNENDPLIQTQENPSFENSVKEVYSMLTRGANLGRHHGDEARFQKGLLPHQEEALEFMLQREKGEASEEYQLWEPFEKSGDTWYRHKVAGINSKALPSEAGGGILADEMGMGKTLSTLALIIKTLKEAHEWSSNRDTHLSDGISPSKPLSHGTLIVVPSANLFTTWHKEIKRHLYENLEVFTYHGSTRHIKIEHLLKYDVVLTTYHTLVFDHHADNKMTDHFVYKPIENIAWFRVVLDEAHFIRTCTTLLHKRVAELQAKNRWCLTGTPIQNKLDDVGALFAFLKIYPFERMNVFRQCISVPFGEGLQKRTQGQRNLAKLLDAYCVRRNKDLLRLKDLDDKVRWLNLSAEERWQYDSVKEDMNRAIRNLAGTSDAKSRFGMFQAQLQLRLLCNHGTFQHRYHWTRAGNMSSLHELDIREDAFTVRGTVGAVQCSNCGAALPPIEASYIVRGQYGCRHVMCSHCRDDTADTCSICQDVKPRNKHNHRRQRIHGPRSDVGYFVATGQSSKMQALVQDLQRGDQSDKSIVFSQWTTTLNLVERHLKHANLEFVRIDGSDDFKHRQLVLDKFCNDVAMPILLATTGVAALGLDIVEANRVFLMEPQWNPSVELQAIGRALRIGQSKSVQVIRYLVQDTVEMDMRKLQERKLNMAGNTKVNNDAATFGSIKGEDY